MERKLVHTRITAPSYPLYKKGLTPEAYHSHQQLTGQTSSLSDEVALLRLILEELLVETGGCDIKNILELAKTIGKLMLVQAEINKNVQGDADFVRKLAEDLRAFHENAASTMPGGAMFGDGALNM